MASRALNQQRHSKEMQLNAEYEETFFHPLLPYVYCEAWLIVFVSH